MAALNRVQLIGRLGRDPEGRYTPTGKKVAHFSLAVSNRWKSREGEMNESTEWVNIEAWDRLGEVCQEFLKKGSLVYLEGRLKTDKYEENGEPRFFTKVVASSIEFLDSKSADDPVFKKQESELEEEVIEYGM
jgi:single-strand DNA-binding protein